MADFMMRKMRLALHEREVPEAVFFTEWSTWKMFFLPDGNMENRKEVARWCSTTWTYNFSSSMMNEVPWWRQIKEDWMYLIRQDNRREDFEYGDFGPEPEPEEEERRPGTDGHRSSSGGEEDDRAFNPFQKWV